MGTLRRTTQLFQNSIFFPNKQTLQKKMIFTPSPFLLSTFLLSHIQTSAGTEVMIKLVVFFIHIQKTGETSVYLFFYVLVLLLALHPE